jgi:putative ABC transport system permease protein
VLKLILRQGAVLSAIGIVLGLAGALALTRVMASLLFGVGSSDPLTYTVAALLLGAITLFATLIPAYKATKVDPIVALRQS